MFGVGFSELIVIAVVALVVVGPKRLPEVMKQAGRLFVHVRRTANDVRSTFEQVIREAEADMRKEEANAIRDALKPMIDAKNDVRALLSDQAAPRVGVSDHPSPPLPAAALQRQEANAATPEGAHPHTPGTSLDASLAAAVPAPEVVAVPATAPAAVEATPTPAASKDPSHES